MKLLKKIYPPLMALIVAFGVTSCSKNEELNNLNENKADLLITSDYGTRAAGFIDCSLHEIDSGPQSYIVVEYTPFLTEQEKQAIRLSYHQTLGNQIFCIDYTYDISNPNNELWLIHGYKNQRPKAQWPEDPEIDEVKTP